MTGAKGVPGKVAVGEVARVIEEQLMVGFGFYSKWETARKVFNREWI